MNQIHVELKDQDTLLNLSFEFIAAMLANLVLTGTIDELNPEKFVKVAIALAEQQIVQVTV